LKTPPPAPHEKQWYRFLSSSTACVVVRVGVLPLLTFERKEEKERKKRELFVER
jgi:hypothetical protein